MHTYIYIFSRTKGVRLSIVEGGCAANFEYETHKTFHSGSGTNRKSDNLSQWFGTNQTGIKGRIPL